MGKIHWIWLQLALGAGAATNKIFENFDNEVDIYNASDYSKQFSDNQKSRLMNKSLEDAYKIIEECENSGYKIITPDDGEYPAVLRNISAMPLVLYMRGSFDFNSEPMISIVGTRKPSNYSVKVATRIAFALAKANVTVVSGGAVGIDTASHKGAILAGGKTVAVLGCGLSVRYLMKNSELRNEIAQHGAVISEFPPFQGASKETFPIRNRIIAALGSGTVVVEAAKHSGSLITARFAKSYGKDIFAVPGAIFNSSYMGVNGLLEDGAIPVVTIKNILDRYEKLYPGKIDLQKAEAYDITDKGKTEEVKIKTKIEAVDNEVEFDLSPSARLTDLPPKTQQVYNALYDGKLHVNDIVQKTNLSLGEVLAQLTQLELMDKLESLPGRVYRLK